MIIMKKMLSIVLAIVLGCMATSAAQPTSLQKKAKSQIFEALRNVVTNVTDAGDELISFNSSGYKFFVDINQEDNGLLYLTMFICITLSEEYDSSIASVAALNAASNKPVCYAVVEGTLMFSCEMYAKDAKPFIDVLPAMLNALSSSVEGFKEAYEKAEKEHVLASSLEMTGNVGNPNDFFYPEGKNTTDSKLYITKVELHEDSTILNMMSYNNSRWQWCSINKGTYLSANGKRYKLLKAEGIAYHPDHTDYPNYQSANDVSLSFKLYFEPLPQGTSTFDFIEINDGWQIYGVTLDNSNIIPIKGERISTAYHFWECESIQLLKGQTVVRKTCRPKFEYTYIYSSQDEFIEDAETGRKYYLQESSIGFEGDPHFTHNTNAIEFAEVYPALPSYIKIINISSGSQYYVKGLKIR